MTENKYVMLKEDIDKQLIKALNRTNELNRNDKYNMLVTVIKFINAELDVMDKK